MEELGPILIILLLVIGTPIALLIWALVSVSALKQQMRVLQHEVRELASRQPSAVHAPVMSSPMEATADIPPAQPATVASPPAVTVSVPQPPAPPSPPAVNWQQHVALEQAAVPQPPWTPPVPREPTFTMPQGGTLFAVA
ncbi:MAG: hypothetical protein H7123_07670, partial [Thermoleophilia bacterium]|nr:hypothetical protein [Thermoleophilia bacterium]